MNGPSRDDARELSILAGPPGPGGDAQALYDDLVRIARAELSRHRRGPTLDTRGLVHEAYVKLANAGGNYVDRRHFFSTAARAMRQVVISYARARLAECRGAGAEHVPLDVLESQPLAIDAQAERLVDVDEALSRLANLEPRLVQVVELRFFSGLEVTEIAELLGVSTATVKRDTRVARAFLESELARDDTPVRGGGG
jgi:RNA polymerase sigma factor (TIGR02999 family)